MSSENNIVAHLRKALFAGLGFGVGFVLANVIGRFINRFGLIRNQFEEISLASIVGLLLLSVFVFMIVGALAGVLGGLGLNRADPSISRRRFVLAGGLGTGFSFGLVLLLLALVLGIVGFFNNADGLEQRFVPILTFFGAFFGLLAGLLLGPLTVGMRFLWVALAGTIGYGLGGAVLGFGLLEPIFSDRLTPVDQRTVPLLLLWLFLFGFIGGGAWGFVYSWLAARKLAQAGQIKVKKRRPLILALQVGLLVALVFIIGYVVVQVPRILRPREADLAEIISTETVGTHWTEPATIAGAGSISGPAVAAATNAALSTSCRRLGRSGRPGGRHHAGLDGSGGCGIDQCL